MARKKKGLARRIISSQRLDMSVTAANGAVGQIQELWDKAAAAREHAREMQDWYEGDLPVEQRPTMPDRAPRDLEQIAETGETPNAQMVVNQISQQMRVEGLRLANSSDSAPAWDLWLRNGMTGKQIALQRAMLTHGQAYTLVLPAVGRLDGEKTALIRPISALRGTAFFRDPFDEYPEVFLDVDLVENEDGRNEHFITFVDDERIHYASCPEGEPDKIKYISSEPHDMGITPVQRYGMVDLDGNALGEIKPIQKLLRRIDQDTVDRLVIQRFASWVVRTASGMTAPKGKNAEEQARIDEAFEFIMSVGDFLISENKDAKFGSLPASPMDGHIRAREADIRDLAATTQVPAYRLLGLSDNIGAEAIAAADSGMRRKADEYKTVIGEEHEGTMRLAGHAAGKREIAEDYTSRCQWATVDDIDLQSIGQALQALNDDGEGIPYELLWKRINGWTQQDTEEAIRIRTKERQERDDRELLQAAMSGGDTGGNDDGNQAQRSAPAGAGSAG